MTCRNLLQHITMVTWWPLFPLSCVLSSPIPDWLPEVQKQARAPPRPPTDPCNGPRPGSCLLFFNLFLWDTGVYKVQALGPHLVPEALKGARGGDGVVQVQWPPARARSLPTQIACPDMPSHERLSQHSCSRSAILTGMLLKHKRKVQFASIHILYGVNGVAGVIDSCSQ